MGRSLRPTEENCFRFPAFSFVLFACFNFEYGDLSLGPRMAINTP